MTKSIHRVDNGKTNKDTTSRQRVDKEYTQRDNEVTTSIQRVDNEKTQRIHRVDNE